MLLVDVARRGVERERARVGDARAARRAADRAAEGVGPDPLAGKTPGDALDDDAVLPQNAEGLEPWVEDLKVETFEGVDHWIEHRIPEEIARAVRELDARASLPSP